MRITPPTALPFTGRAAADELLATEPMALLIGFLLDQQVTVQQAFGAPQLLATRVGTLDAARIAGMDPVELEAAFRERPALHRFPANMARRTQALCVAISESYGGDAARIWLDAADAADLESRLLALPGIGPMKARTLMGILGRRFGLQLPGLAEAMPTYPTLADVDSPEALAAYQSQKRAYKASLKAGTTPDPETGRPLAQD
jgi:uncharacterized HhH-GPD family protein